MTACGGRAPSHVNSPGTNLKVNDIAIRYAHLENPDGEDGYQKGDDIPLYLWAVNESDTAAQFSAASSPIAADVSLSQGSLPVSLGTRKLVDLGPSRPHLVLRQINTQVRGAEFVPVTITFGDGTRVQMMVEPIDVKGPDETPSTQLNR